MNHNRIPGRPTLVYETRIYVKDPSGELKLGAPVIVTL